MISKGRKQILFKYILKNEKLIIFFILALGLVLRFYAATTVPLNWDEEDFFRIARKISFNLKKPSLPLVDTEYPSPISIKYVIKLGITFFGDNILGGRIPYIILGMFTLLFVYLVVRKNLGKKKALLALLLLTFSQFHIGYSRIANDDGLIFFFGFLILYFFHHALKQASCKKIILCGFLIGISYFVKENLSFFLAIFFIFLIITPKYRFWLRRKEPYIAASIALVFIFTLTFLNYIKSMPRINFVREESALGFSINAIGLYLGELIIIAFKKYPNLNLLLDTTDYEYPFIFWVMGLLCLIGVFYSLRDRKKDFIRLLVVTFFFNFILFSLVKNKENFVVSLGSVEWGSLSFLPAVILSANMLGDAIEKNKIYYLFIATLLFVFAWNAWKFINFPLNCFIPIRGYAEKEWLSFAEYDYSVGELNKAKDTYERIYRIAERKSHYKKIAALRLAQISIQKQDYREARKFLNFLLSVYPGHEEALRLSEELGHGKDSY